MKEGTPQITVRNLNDIILKRWFDPGISGAWWVVERMREHGFGFVVDSLGHVDVVDLHCSEDQDLYCAQIENSDIPEAIIEAALLALRARRKDDIETLEAQKQATEARL